MSDDNRKPTLGDRFGRRATAGSLGTTGIQQIAQDVPQPPSTVTQLSGSLREKPISYLLQMADHYEATGQLQVGGFQYTVVIQFGLGKPIHAYSPFNTGTEAILELFTWQDGKVSFTEGIQPQTPSVEDSAPQILTMGDEYVSNMEFLQRLDITELSFLLRSSLKLNEQELEKLLISGAPISVKMQKEFYGNIYGSLNIKDIAIKMQLSESRWMGTVVNLLKLGLILTPDGKTLEQTGLTAPAPVQRKAVPPPQELNRMITNDLSMLDHGAVPPAAGSQAAPSGSWGNKDQATTGGWAKDQSTTGSGPLMPPMGVFQVHALQEGPKPAEPAPQASAPPSTPPFTPPPLPPLEPTPSAAVPFQTPTFQAPPAPAQVAAPPAPPPPQPSKTIHLGVPSDLLLFDNSITAKVQASLIRQETGILSQEALLYLLEREFARAFRFSTSFTLMPFCITVSATGWPVLPVESVALITNALNQMRRDVDLFGHFGDRCFAMILPNVDSNQACGLVDRVATTLPQCIPQLAEYAPILHFGIASVPTDAKDLPGLISAAQTAMLEAARRNVTRVRFVELNQSSTPLQQPAVQTEPPVVPAMPGPLPPPLPPPPPPAPPHPQQ